MYRMLFGIILLPLVCVGQREQIIFKHLEDYGQDLWENVHTLQIDGKEVNEDYKAFPLQILLKEDAKIRIQGGNEKGRFLMGTYGNGFWFQGSVADDLMKEVEKAITQNAVTIGSPMAKYQDQLAYSGLQVVDGDFFHTFAAKENESTITYFLDKESLRLVYQDIIVSHENETKSLHITYEKYKSHHGLMLPTALQITTDDFFREWVLESTTIGVPASDDLFLNPQSQ